MIFQFKQGTEVEVLTDGLLLGVLGLAHVMHGVLGARVLVITSVNDGKHKPGSLHYSGNAVDIRSKTWPRDKVLECVQTFKQSPDGSRYDLIFESVGTPNEHLHLEFDPQHQNG